jgi:O-antigen/teichoic acid export membrane protein
MATLTERLSGSPAQFLRLFARRALHHQLTRNLSWQMAGTLVSSALALGSSIGVARLLGREHFGEYGMVIGTVQTFAAFAAAGLGLTNTRYIALLRKSDPETASEIIGMSVLISCGAGALLGGALHFAAPWLAAHTLGAPELSPLLSVGAIAIAASSVNAAQLGVLAGCEAFRTLAAVNVVRSAITAPAILAGAWTSGLPGVVWGFAIAMVITCVVAEYAATIERRRAGLRLQFRIATERLRILWTFSTPALVAGVVVAPAIWLASSLLVNTPGGYLEMGVFSAAFQWRTVMLFVPSNLGQVLLPMFAASGAHAEPKAQQTMLWNVVRANAVYTALTAAIIAAMGHFIMRAYGPGFSGGGPVLSLIAVSTCLLCIQLPIGHFLIAAGEMWLCAAMNTTWGILLVLGTWLLVAKGALGAIGLALAYLLAYTVHLAWHYGVAAKIISRRCLPARTADVPALVMK